MAKRFSFRLEPLLKLRDALEKEAQRALARSVEARMAVEARLQDLRDQHQTAWMSRQAQPGQILDLDRWRAVERFLMVMERTILATQGEVAEAEALVEKARQELTRVHQEHMTLLRLKERLQEQHAQDVLHEDIQAADEMAVLRHRFSNRSVPGTESLPESRPSR